MGVLAWYLLTSAGDADTLELLEMFGEMGWALVASGTGVLGNLAILCWLLPLADRRFTPELDRFLDALRKKESKQHSKRKIQSQTTTKINDDRFGEELRRAIARVPSMFDQIGETATVLDGAVAKLHEDMTKLTSTTATLVRSTSSLNRMPESLDTVLSKVLEDLSDEADALRNDMRMWKSERRSEAAESHAKIQSVIEKASSQYNGATDKMNETVRVATASVEALPSRVASAIEGSGESLARKFNDKLEQRLASFRDGIVDGLDKIFEWQNAVSEHLDEARRQHDRATHDLVTTTADVVARVQSLPGAVAAGVEKVSEKLGLEFGHEAHQHVTQLRSALQEDAKELRDELQKHEKYLLDTTMQELRKISEHLLNKTVHDLGGISEKLAAVLDCFPDRVATVNARLTDVESELTDIVARIEETSLALRSAHDKTGDMLAGLGRSTEDLGQVIRELAEALRKPRRKGWWWKFSRRSYDEIPSASPRRRAT